MNCSDFEARFDDFVEERLAGEMLEEARRHAETCDACRTLVTLESRTRAQIASLPSASECDLTDGVLARTTGPACPSARGRLGDFVDAVLPPDEAGLVAQHLERCEACAGLARTLAWLATELPSLAHRDPGTVFTEEVLQRTTRRRWRPRAMAARTRAALRAWTRRPRFALEGAYVGAMIFWFLIAVPHSPMSGMPERMLALARFDAAAFARVPPTRILANPVAAGRDAWSATAGEWIDSTGPTREAFSERIDRAGEHLGEMGRQGKLMGERILEGSFEEGGNHLRSMGIEARTIWRILRGAGESPSNPMTAPPTTSTTATPRMKEA